MIKSKSFTETKYGLSGKRRVLLIALIGPSLIWVSGCTTIIKVKPDGALTVPVEKQVRDKFDTPRTLLIKFEQNNQAIDDVNKRLEIIRE